MIDLRALVIRASVLLGVGTLLFLLAVPATVRACAPDQQRRLVPSPSAPRNGGSVA